MEKSIITPSLMTPMLPGQNKELSDLSVTLIEHSSRMASQLNPMVQQQIGDLVRSMNCYYSNLIEGHNTSPKDIERALSNDYSDNREKRDLQLEAKAHIDVQLILDTMDDQANIYSEDIVKMIHREFYSRLPESLKWATDVDSGKKIAIVPGEFRTSDVVVGQHIAPEAEFIARFLQKFSEAYDFKKLSRIDQIIAIAAAHHRLLWIHPFYDGNGRVSRLLSHVALKEAGVGNSLWSISRGLARNSQEYKNNLSLADQQRLGDLDGRGNLSEKYLFKFCEFFLLTAIDQVKFMQKLLDLSTFLDRIESYATAEISKKKLLKGSNVVLKEALLKGNLQRGAISNLTGYSDRQSRAIIAMLIKNNLLRSDSPYGDLYLSFPQHVVQFYFPLLYPVI